MQTKQKTKHDDVTITDYVNRGPSNHAFLGKSVCVDTTIKGSSLKCLKNQAYAPGFFIERCLCRRLK